MECARSLEDLQMNDDGEITFIHAVKLVLRIVFAKNDKDLMEEIEMSETKLCERDPQALERMKKNEEKHMLHSGLSSGVNMRAQIAASKIQRLFKARKARREACKTCELKRLERSRSAEEKQA